MKWYNERNMKNFTDRVDVSLEISLGEYGIVRNPKTNVVIFYDETFDRFTYDDISLEDVKEALETQRLGFFRYIGSTLKKELECLDNENLAHIINSLNSWNGWFLSV